MIYSRSATQMPSVASSRGLLLVQIVLCSLLIALSAQIRIALPFTPVPITFQTLAVLLIGGMLGKRHGALAVIVYLTEAVMGLPVLSGGRSDPLFLFSPVGGYLLGFVAQAYLAGWFLEKRTVIGKPLMFLGLGLACAVQILCGALYLSFFVGAKHAWMLGVAPFICGELLKIILAGMFFKRYLHRC